MANWWDADPIAEPPVPVQAVPGAMSAIAAPAPAGAMPWDTDPIVSSQGRSAALGAGQGLAMGFLDEASAGLNAGLDRLLGVQPKTPGGSLYDERLASARAQLGEAEKANPKTFLGSQVGGGIAGSVALPMIGAGVKGAIATGAAYGGLQGVGEGEGVSGRMVQGATGAFLGGALGPVGYGIGKAVQGVTEKVGERVGPYMRAMRNGDDEAERRVASVVGMDNVKETPTIAPNGQPTILADYGGRMTRDLTREMSNKSGAAGQALNDAVNPRFADQTGRIEDFIGELFGGRMDAGAIKDAIQTTAKTVNRPAYAKAMSEGAAGIWDDELGVLASAPAVQQAIRGAIKTGANKSAADGFPAPKNPFVENADGTFALRVNEDGSLARPTLQFWDHVKRNLDDVAGKAVKDNEKNLAGDVTGLKNQIVAKLDAIAPSYATARAGAATFFGAENALEAGQKFVTSTMQNQEARRGIAKMSPAEKELFANGFAADFISKMREVGSRRDVLNSAFLSSPAAKERIVMAMGPEKAAKLEAFLRIESIMQATKNAVQGNSTTTQQLIQAGIVGGVQGGGAIALATGGDLQSASMGALLAAAVKTGRVRIDTRMAQKMGELLATNDPAKIKRVMDMAGKTPTVLKALRGFEDYLTRLAGVQAGNSAGAASNAAARFMGQVPARAEDEQGP